MEAEDTMAGAAFGCGILVGFFTLLIVSKIVDPGADLITKCEANLPRAQHCILQAVPEKK